MYFSYKDDVPGYSWTGGHDTVGSPEIKTSWFFAEGPTMDNFDEYICIGNPEDEPAHVTLRFLLEDGSIRAHELDVAPLKRSTVMVADIVGRGHNVCTEVESNESVIAERPMYFNYNGVWTGGSDMLGF
jgi:hypothetical protein